MRLLLVTSEPGWVEALHALFPVDGVIEAESDHLERNPALAAACDACFVAEATTSRWTVDTLKRISAVTEIPLFVLAESDRSQWEEAALFAGAQQFFRRPLRANVIQLAISRFQRLRTVGPGFTMSSQPQDPAPAASDSSLAQWRDFSRLFRDVSDRDRLIDGYLGKLREVLQSVRVLLFIPQAAGAGRTFRCSFAAGVSPRQFEAFLLNQRNGIAQLVTERGGVIWRHRLRCDSSRDAVAMREMAVFGAELAVPVAGPNGIEALLLVGPRVSGREYTETEATQLFHAIEGIGLLLSECAVVSRERAGADRDSAVLQMLPIAGAIVNDTPQVAEANAALRALLGREGTAPVKLDHFPASWSAAITAAVESRAASARVELEHGSAGAPGKLRLTVRLLDTGEGRSERAAPSSFLVTIEDMAPLATAAHEADAFGVHNLLQRAGEQLSNEFRNALTPVDIMVQLSRDSGTSRSELEQLGNQVGTAIHRLRRRIDDLAYLTRSAIIPERTTVSAIARSARERLDDWLEDRQLKRIVWLNEFSETELIADVRALALALGELVMNGIEASEGRQVTVTAEVSDDSVNFRVRNSGAWEPHPESSGFRHRPFVSSKSTGVGLGVEVASRVAEYHGGRLVLGPISPDVVEAVLRIPRRSAGQLELESAEMHRMAKA